MNKIKSKLDVLIKKDMAKINRLDKKKYYKIFEKLFDHFNKSIPNPKKLREVLKKAKNDIKTKRMPMLKLSNKVKSALKKVEKIMSIKDLKEGNSKVVGFYFKKCFNKI